MNTPIERLQRALENFWTENSGAALVVTSVVTLLM
jgi:hypothetical protein